MTVKRQGNKAISKAVRREKTMAAKRTIAAGRRQDDRVISKAVGGWGGLFAARHLPGAARQFLRRRMDARGVTPQELARRMDGWTKADVDRLLDGRDDMTAPALCDALTALDRPRADPRGGGGDSPIYCGHANESPATCPCPAGCYCRVRGSCKAKKPGERGSGSKLGGAPSPEAAVRMRRIVEALAEKYESTREETEGSAGWTPRCPLCDAVVPEHEAGCDFGKLLWERLVDAMPDPLDGEIDIGSLRGGVRGKYCDRMKEGTNLVLLAPDVHEHFRDAGSVNDALRKIIRIGLRRRDDVIAALGERPRRPRRRR
jgi:hypothetical protein